MTQESRWSRSVRRHSLGVAGILCLGIGIYFTISPPANASVEFLQGSCIKSGLVLLATWLAFDQLDRLPTWLFVTSVGTFLAIAVRPRIVLAMLRSLMFLAPILFLIWALRPRRKPS